MKDIVVIYHGGCPDGFTSAWAASLKFGSNADYVPAYYSQNGADVELPDLSGKTVWMLDFCVGKDQLERLIAETNSIRVLDHHISAKDVCGEFEQCTFDMERSGAGITWDVLHPVVDRPWLIDYVEDRDLWRHRLPHSKAVNAYVMSQPMTFDMWNALSGKGVEEVAKGGEGCLAYLNHYVEKMCKEAIVRDFAGHTDIPVVNAPYVGTSDLVGKLAEGVQFAVGWFVNRNGLYQYSLRSRGDDSLDVAKLATELGGGGHRNAAGFVKDFLV